MSRSIMLSVLAVSALAVGATTAAAADLSTQSRLGAIFAEPAPAVVYRPARYEAPVIPYNLLPNPPWNRGNYNYGSSWSYYYPGPYYGGPYDLDGPRLPYVCGLYGYC